MKKINRHIWITEAIMLALFGVGFDIGVIFPIILDLTMREAIIAFIIGAFLMAYSAELDNRVTIMKKNRAKARFYKKLGGKHNV